MTRYSIQQRDQIFIKCYGFLSFGKNMGRIIVTNIRESTVRKNSQSAKQRQKLLDLAKQFATDALKTTSKRTIKKTAETTGD